MNQFRLQSSSLTIVRNTTNNVVNKLINLAVRLLTFKNALILSLFCFLLVSAVFQLDSSSSSSSRRYFTYIVARTNGSLRVREIRRSSHLSVNISKHNNFTSSIDSSYQEGAEIATDMFEEEANAIKDSIRNAFLSVNKKIDYCPLFLDTLKGLLNVTEILELIHLNGLVQFHDKNSFNLSSNKYNENELTYLDERKLEANKNNVRFREFWDIWHSNDLNRLNETVEGVDSDLEFGGRWRPPNCQSRYRVAIIIPYRDRLPHLMVLVKYLHVFLKRQMIDYQIFVVEPTTPLSIKFNKGRVMNSAYLEALKIDPSFNCVIFHDVDLIPEDDRNMYTCSTRPKHLSVGIDKFNYRLPYDYLVGGVFSIKTVQYREINGYSNSYWGWGGEDDDFAARIKHSKLTVNRPPTKIARYKMMRHKLQKLNEERHRLLRKTHINHRSDGLNSVKYKVIQKRIFNGFTYFLVDIGNP